MEKINPARVLINDYLQLRSLSQNTKLWTTDYFSGNPPRLYRLLRINACSLALGLKYESWDDFQTGAITRKDDSVIDIDRILNVLKEIGYVGFNTDRWEIKDIDESFYIYICLGTRWCIQQFSSLSASVLCASENYIPPLMVLDRISDEMKKYKNGLDEVLSLILNPSDQLFTKDELIQSFEFPDVNLDEIDLNWI